MIKKIVVTLLMTTIVGTSFLGCSTSSNEVNGKAVEVIKVAHNQGTDHPTHLALLEFEKEIEEKSNYELDVQIYPNELLGSQRETVELTQTGIIDMTVASISLLESFESMYSVFNIPYLFDNIEHYYSVMNDEEIIDPLYEQTRNDGFIGLTWYYTGTRNIYTNNKPIETPNDLKGLKIRVQQSATNIKMIQLLGGSPTPMGFGEVYTALQQNVLDGAENNEGALVANKHGEVSKFYSYTQHAMIPDILIMNAKRFDNFDENYKQIILDAAKNSNLFEIESMTDSLEDSKEKAEKMGVKFNYPNITEFQELVMPIHDEFKNSEETGAIYKKIREKANDLEE